jgi:hypothetical protein
MVLADDGNPSTPARYIASVRWGPYITLIDVEIVAGTVITCSAG